MPLTVRQRSIHNKNGAKRASSFNKGKRRASEGDYIVTNAPTDLRSISYPGGAVALGLLLAARIISAIWNHISDCDETFNYWEPLHYLVYGNGLQTWEYSPVYAIRSYMPLWLLAQPAKLLSYFLAPVSVFYALRILLAIHTAAAEFMFYKAVCHEFGVNVGRIWLALTLPAAGSFVASTAMLPSAWSGAMMGGAIACWWRRRYHYAVFLTAASTLISWPFTAILGISIAIDMLIMKNKYKEFIIYSFISFIIIMVPMLLIDYWYYGRLVIAPWNIVAYNIFTEHGPDLYGTEPWTFYFMNTFLNFNLVMVFALQCPLILLACHSTVPKSVGRAGFCTPYWMDLLPLGGWLVVFGLQAHKEERFLYPVYSLLVLCAAITVDCTQKMLYMFCTSVLRWSRDPFRLHYLHYTSSYVVLYLALTSVGGLSRIVALNTNYQGTITILHHLPPTDGEQYVCYGKDWYRSPSSFHLPSGYKMRFIQSEFNGQMPAPYSDDWNATRLTHSHFNDGNIGNNSTYLAPIDCDYLIDSDIDKPSKLQPAYYKDPNWEIIDFNTIINSAQSNKITRAFYVPFFSFRLNVYGKIYLLKNKVKFGPVQAKFGKV